MTPRHILVRDRATANDFTRELHAYQVSAGIDDTDSFRLYQSVKLRLKPARHVSIGYIVRNHVLLSPMAQAFITAMEVIAKKNDIE